MRKVLIETAIEACKASGPIRFKLTPQNCKVERILENSDVWMLVTFVHKRTKRMKVFIVYMPIKCAQELTDRSAGTVKIDDVHSLGDYTISFEMEIHVDDVLAMKSLQYIIYDRNKNSIPVLMEAA